MIGQVRPCPLEKRNGAVAEGEVDIANAKAMDPNIVKEFAGYGVR